jgi:O-antigen/teichoic acid export membrane protein
LNLKLVDNNYFFVSISEIILSGDFVLVKLVRNTGWVALGIASGQGLILLATPYLARIFTPADFGSFALLNTISNISMAVACLRFDLAIPSAQEEDTHGLMITSVLAAIFLGGLSAVVLILALKSTFSVFLISPFTSPILVVLCVILVGIFQATTAWCLRNGAYKGVAIIRLSQGASFSILATVPGFGLLWPHVLSFATALVLLRTAFRDSKTAQQVSWRKAAMKAHQFPLMSLPGAVLDVVGYSICIWVITAAYGTSQAGQYAQIQRMIGAPLMLVSMSIGQVLLKHTADIASSKAALRLLLKGVLKITGALATIGFAAVAAFGEPVLRLLLGAQWRVDRRFVCVVAVAVFVRSCVSPLSSVLITLRRFDLALTWQVLYFLSALCLLPFFAAKFQFDNFVVAFAVQECFFYGFYLCIIKFALRD